MFVPARIDKNDIFNNREVRVLLSHSDYRKAVQALVAAESLHDLANVPICGAMIDINSRCNFGNCLNCIDQLSVNRPRLTSEMPWQKLKNLVEDLVALGCRFIEPMGGEPMLYSAYGEFLRLCAKLNVALKVVSNGSLAHQHEMELIEVSRIAGSSIRFSVNGDNVTYGEITGVRNPLETYCRILANILFLAKAGVEVLVSYVVFPENCRTIASTARQVKSCGASSFLVLPGRDWRTKKVLMSADVSLKEELAKTLELEDHNFQVTIPQTFLDAAALQPKQYHRCACAFLKPVIGVEGKLFVCSYFKQRDDAVLGRIGFNGRFRDVWKSEMRAKRLAGFNPERMCRKVSCTRHFLNCFVDFLNRQNVGVLAGFSSGSFDELFF
jgi:MoaA/NifB/PqqE/SkfB family radical SAM enzyme